MAPVHRRGRPAWRAQPHASSLEAAGRSFRDFFHAVIALMKEHQVTAIYNHENPELLGMSSVMGPYGVSSLVDNIILLNFVELGDSFRQAADGREDAGNPADRTTHECEVVNGHGMRVLPRGLPALPRAGLLLRPAVALWRALGAPRGAGPTAEPRRVGHGGLAPRRIGGRFGEGGARKGALTVQVAPRWTASYAPSAIDRPGQIAES